MNMEDNIPDIYTLSFQAQLSGTARCVCADDENGFVAATTEGIISSFIRKAPTKWSMSQIFGTERLHGTNPGLILSICRHKKGTFVSGGSDKKGLIWTTSGDRLAQLVGGHSGSINSVAQCPNGDIITGAQDGTAIVWRHASQLYKLEGHQHGVEVAALPSGEVCSASGNMERGIIRVWRDGQMVDQNQSAHERIIRKIIQHPLGFASCANDGYVKVWAQGPPMTCIMSCLAHPATEKLDSFVYSICVSPSGELVSAGEDGFVRVIAQDGSITQSIRHPSSVRDVLCLSNGDLVTACSDGFVRVWTRCLERTADSSTCLAYEELLAATESQSVQSLDPSQLKPESVLQSPGSRPGEVVIVDISGRGAIVYQWNHEDSIWIEVGSALVATQQRPRINDVEYDHVIDVFVADGVAPIKLGFNASDDPDSVARAFCERYGLGEEAFPQIVARLAPLANPVARLERQERERMQNLRYIPLWKNEGFIIDSRLAIKQLETAIKRANNDMTPETILNEQQLYQFALILELLDKSHKQKLPFTPDMRNVVEHLLLKWPFEKLPPVLDFIRQLSIVYPDFVQQPSVIQKLIEIATLENPIHLAIVLKVFGNWIAKRQASPAFDNALLKVLHGTSGAAKHANPVVAATYINLLHNYLCYIRWYFKGQVEVMVPLLTTIASSINTFFMQTRNEKPTYMAILIIGTIGFFGKFGQILVRDAFGSRLAQLFAQFKTSSNQSIQQAAIEAERCI